MKRLVYRLASVWEVTWCIGKFEAVHVTGSVLCEMTIGLFWGFNCFFYWLLLVNNDLEVLHPWMVLRLPFLVELEFGNVGLWREGNTEVLGEKPLEAKERANNKLNPHMTSMRGFKPVPHSWQGTAYTTSPSVEPWLCGFARNSPIVQCKATLTQSQAWPQKGQFQWLLFR